jgi:putative FmdB family regulatory protein
MPTYEYQCQACHHCLESFQKISDAPLKKCPECGKNTLKKQMSASAFQLKGSGWYVTDFRNKDTKKEEKKTESSTETAKAPETKSTVDKPEKKTEAKTETKTKPSATET